MKAFVVKHVDRYYDDDAPTMIYFVSHDIHARRAFADEYNDSELTGISVKREKALDRYADTSKIPFWLLACMGWWTECDHCGGLVSEDAMNERNLDVTNIVGTFRSRCFCSPVCHDNWKEEQAERKHVIGKALFDLEKYLLEQFPGVTITRTQANTMFKQNQIVLDYAHVFFTFPAQNFGECRITESKVVTVPRGAMTMFNKWRGLDAD